MRKFRFLSLALVSAAAMVFTSCEDDKDPVLPILTVTEANFGITNGKVSMTQGGTLDFSWDARKGDVDLKTFSISVLGNVIADTTNNGNVLPYTLKNADDEKYIDGISFMPNASGEYVFTVTDKDGEIARVTVDVMVETTLGTEITGAFFHIEGLGKGAWDLMGDKSMAKADPTSEKDMINNDAAGVTFTGSWVAGNTTMFVKANGFDYDNATMESAMTAYNGGTAANSVANPANGDIYIAYVRGMHYMVIKIVNVDPNDTSSGGGNNGKITFDYKKS